MIQQILVPLDGSELALKALPHAKLVAKAFNSRVAVLHVVEPAGDEGSGEPDPINWHLRKAEAQAYLSAVCNKWGSEETPLDNVLLEGPAAASIIDYVDKSQPDLIVLSSHGERGLSRWNLSSVAQKIIYRAFRSILLVRAYRDGVQEPDEVRYRRIVVPLDGSKRAEYALPMAGRLAQAHDARLVLVLVVSKPQLIPQQPLTEEDYALAEQLMGRNEAAAGRYLEQVQAHLPAEVDAQVFVGPSDADALLDFADESNTDLIVMNAHGASGERKRPYGSVVNNLIAYSSSHLMVVQDVPPAEIKPSGAELASTRTIINGTRSRTVAHGQPAIWIPR